MTEECPETTNAWHFEAEELAKARRWNYYRAYDHVLVRYLLEGDDRPLLDLICNLEREPGRRASEFIAAMTDAEILLKLTGVSDLPRVQLKDRFRDIALPYEIRISERRGRGRASAEAECPETAEIRRCMVLGFSAIASGEQPPSEFWLSFAFALGFDGSERWIERPFPFKAQFVRPDGKTGRRRDPEIPVRAMLIRSAVSKKMAEGAKYEAAVKSVKAEWDILIQSDRRSGQSQIGSRNTGTFRAGYDKVNRRFRRP